MDYVTKIMIDTSKANRNIKDFEKVLKGGDAAVRKMKDDLNALHMQFQRNEMEKATKDADLYQKELKRLNTEFVKLKNVQREEAQVVRQNNKLKENQTNLTIKEIRALERKAEAIMKIQHRTDQMNATRAKEYQSAKKGLATLDKEYRMTLKVEHAKEKLNKAVKEGLKTRSQANKILRNYRRELSLTEKNLKRVTNQATLFNKALRFQTKLFHAVMLAMSVKTIVDFGVSLERTAEKFELLNKKITHFTKNTYAFDAIKIQAMSLGVSVEDLGRIMTRFAITTKNAFSTDEMLVWTSALVKSARATGTTTQEMNNALLQLSQSFSAGFLMGDEYRSISENLPMFKQALEETAKAQGVFTGSLKEMSSSRKIDINLMTDAMLTLQHTVDQIPGVLDTIDSAIERFKVGWGGMVSVLVDTDFTKTSLNFLSGLFAHLSDDSAIITGIAETFPELNKQITDLIDSFSLFTFSLGLLADQMGMVFTEDQKQDLKDYAIEWYNFEKWFTGEFLLNAMKDFPNNVSTIIKLATVQLTVNLDLWGAQLKISMINAFQGLQDLLPKFTKWNNEISKSLFGFLADRYKSNEKIGGFFNDQLKKAEKFGNEIQENKEKWFSKDKKLLEEEVQLKTAAAIELMSGYLKDSSDRKKIRDQEIIDKKNQLEEERELENSYHGSVAYKIRQETGADKNLLDRRYDTFKKQSEALKITAKDLKKVELLYKKYDKAISKAYVSHYKGILSEEELNEVMKKSANSFSKQLKLIKDGYTAKKKSASQLRAQTKALEKAKDAMVKYNEVFQKNQLLLDNSLQLLPSFVEETNEHKEQTERLTLAMKKQVITVEQYKDELVKLKEQLEKIKEIKTEKHLEGIISRFDKSKEAAFKFRDEIKDLNKAYKAGLVSLKSYNKYLYDQKKAFLQAQAAAGDFGASLTLSMDNLVGDIGENFKTMMVDAFDGTEDAFESFTERLEDLFKNMLVDMAYQALINPIIVSVQQSMMGGGFGGSQGNQSGSSSSGINPSKFMGNSSSIFNNPNVKIMDPSTWSGIWGSGLTTTGATTASTAIAASSPAIATGGIAPTLTNMGYSSTQLLASQSASPVINSGIAATVPSSAGLSPSANIGMSSLIGGYTASQVGGWEGVAAGAATGLGSVALGGAITGYGASAALAAMGPVGWAALAVSLIMGSGVLGGNSDVTPDLNLQYSNTNADKLLNPAGTKIHTYGLDDDDRYDPNVSIAGRFAGFNFSTQHDAFGTEEEVDEFVNALSTRYFLLEETIFQTFGEEVSAQIKEDMGKFQSGEIKFEDFGGASDFDQALHFMFSQIFKGVGKNLDEDISIYEQVFKEAMGAFDNSLELSVGAVAGIKDVMDSDTERSMRNVGETIKLFVNDADGLEEQMAELAATTQLLKLEALDEDFKKFISTVEGFGKNSINYTAQELLRLGTQLISVNTTFKNINMTMFDTSIAGAKAADSFVTLIGGFDAFSAKTSFYYQNFFTESERLAKTVESSANAIAGFNEKWDTDIQSKEDLRNIIESLGKITDETSEETKKFIVALFDLAYPMQENVDATEALANARAKEAKEAIELEKTFTLLSAKLSGTSSFVQDQMNVDFLSKTVATLGVSFSGTNDSFSSFINGLDYTDPKVKALSSDILALGNAIFATTANVGAAHKDITNTQHLFQGEERPDYLERQKSYILKSLKGVSGVFSDIPDDMEGVSTFIKGIDWNNKTLLAAVPLFKELFTVTNEQVQAEKDLLKARIEFNQAMSDLISQLLGESEQELINRRMKGFGEDLAILGKELPTTALGFVDFINALDDTDPEVIALKDSLLGYGQAILDTVTLQERLNEEIKQFNLSINELYYALLGESDVQNAIRQIEEVYAVFGAVGSHTAITTNDLAKYIKTLDRSSKSNQEAWHEIEKLGNALITLKEIIADLEDSILVLKEDLFGGSAELNDLLQQRADLLGTSVALYEIEKERYEAAIEANEKIIDFLNDISLSDKSILSPLEKINEAARLFQEAIASGNVDDATSYGKTYLGLAKEGYGSTTEYASIYDEVSAAVGGMTDTSLKNVDIAQLDALNEQIQNEEDNIEIQKSQNERLGKANDLLDNIFKLALAKDISMVESLDLSGIGIDILGSEFSGNQLGDKLLNYAVENGLTTTRLAEIIGVSNQDLLDYLKVRGFSDEDISYWNKLNYKEAVSQKEILTLIQEDFASISQTETYKAAAEDGYGGNYSDNQILQFSGEYIYKNYEQLLLIASNTQRTANNLQSLNNGLGIIPSYESGTGYVPQDQLAYLHQGEMVINSDMATNVRKGSGGSNSELINEVRELNEEMRNLRVEVQSLKVINSYGFKESIKQGKRQANAQEEAIEIKRMSE